MMNILGGCKKGLFIIPNLPMHPLSLSLSKSGAVYKSTVLYSTVRSEASVSPCREKQRKSTGKKRKKARRKRKREGGERGGGVVLSWKKMQIEPASRKGRNIKKVLLIRGEKGKWRWSGFFCESYCQDHDRYPKSAAGTYVSTHVWQLSCIIIDLLG
ncbi:unnamed protein product [Tuber aestivum]|uniref:Uncharacterized protein n=1 Tax=Tuber aestivum TaxID=59557 RepID=A0A292Q600_9PEZI|nr:unnamed protein product [Tuber aestivum]